jgi:AcrR family transcriptional regulator
MLHGSRVDADGDPMTVGSIRARAAGPRERILEAMIATVAYRGYERTTIERVLQAAAAPGAVFDEHFTDKEECFCVALDGVLAGIETRVVACVGDDTPWPRRVRNALQALLLALSEDPDGARVLLVECLSAGAAAERRHRALLQSFPPLLEEGRFHAADAERLPDGTAEALVGGLVAILHRRALEDRTGELPRLVGDLAYFALLPYLGHHRALLAAYAKSAAAA